MNKRIVLVVGLWFYAGWALGALLTEAFALHPTIGPLLGAFAAAAFPLGPRLLVVRRRM